MIKSVFLDLDDTILDFQKGERRAIYKAFVDMGLPVDDSIINRYIEINLSCWQALERGEMTKDQVLVDRFRLLFDELEITRSADEAQEIYENYLKDEHDFIEGAEELLNRFMAEGKYDLYMATNGIPSVQKPRIKDADIAKYFKEIFISEDIGYAKPSKKFFNACFEMIEDFSIDKTIIVGDSLTSDILGGKNSGIKTCHFNPKNRPYGSIIPDYKINKLSELIDLLDSIE